MAYLEAVLWVVLLYHDRLPNYENGALKLRLQKLQPFSFLDKLKKFPNNKQNKAEKMQMPLWKQVFAKCPFPVWYSRGVSGEENLLLWLELVNPVQNNGAVTNISIISLNQERGSCLRESTRFYCNNREGEISVFCCVCCMELYSVKAW